MNRDELEAFFARADDVLTDWQPGHDAMIARVPDDDDREALAGDSYYEQITRPRFVMVQGGSPAALRLLAQLQDPAVRQRIAEHFNRAVAPAIAEAFRGFAVAMQEVTRQLNTLGRHLAELELGRRLPPVDESPRDRALRLRQQRNTGPANPRQLDGRRTRAAHG